MTERLLLDTDVIIDHLRGQADAVGYIGSLTQAPATSVVVVAELYAGVRDGAERHTLIAFLRGLEILPLNEAAATQAGLYRREYGRSHNVGLPDALIAATAQLNAARLVTLNLKHFPMLSDVIVPYAKAER